METKIRDNINPALSTPQSGEYSKRILIIQSASRVLNKALGSLKKEFPNASFTILTANPNALRESEILNETGVDQISPLPEGQRISIFSYGFTKRKKLREQNFDLAVVLYNIDKGSGYSNVESLAWSTGADEQRGYYPDGSFRHITAATLLKNILREQATLGWVVLNVITAIFQIFVAGVAMTVETLYRRVFSKSSSGTSTSKPE